MLKFICMSSAEQQKHLIPKIDPNMNRENNKQPKLDP